MEYFIKASGVLVIFYICYKLFLQRETFFNANRWFLLIGLFIASILPLLVIPIYVEYTPFSLPNNPVTGSEINEPVSNQITFLRVTLWIYTIGFIFFLGKLIIEFTSLLSLLKNNHPEKIDGFTYIETTQKTAPFSFFNWIVYNPKQFEAQELTYIINHEKVHAKQYHSIDVILSQISCVVFWFNPFFWLYKKELQQNLEFIADKEAQGISNCEKSYQRLLVKASISNHQLIITNNFYNSLIKKRIVMLHKSQSNKSNAWKFGLILPLLALFLMSFNTKEVFIASSSVNNSLQNRTNEGTVLITKDFTDTELDKIKSQLLQEGFTIKIKGVKRNVSGEIIAIKIDATSNNSSAHYNTKTDNPISPIKISVSKDGNQVSIGSTSLNSNKPTITAISSDNHTQNFKSNEDETHTFVLKTEDSFLETEIESTIDLDKLSTTENVYFISTNNSNQVDIAVKDEHGNLVKNGEQLFISTSQTNASNSTFFSSSEPKSKHMVITKKLKDGQLIKEEIKIEGENTFVWEKNETTANHKTPNSFKLDEEEITLKSIDEESPIFILDGKEITNEEMKQVTPDIIANVNVLKGEKALEKYGEKGKDGVIEITTKK